MAEAKHAFVDDNPYLVYTPNAEMTYDGNSGGTGFPVITLDENGDIDITAGELKSIIENTPVVICDLYQEVISYLYFVEYTPSIGGYIHTFFFISITNKTVTVLEFGATADDAKPTLQQSQP